MLPPTKVLLPFLIAASFLLQGCGTTKPGESRCPFAKLVQKDAPDTSKNQEAPAKPESQQQAH